MSATVIYERLVLWSHVQRFCSQAWHIVRSVRLPTKLRLLFKLHLWPQVCAGNSLPSGILFYFQVFNWKCIQNSANIFRLFFAKVLNLCCFVLKVFEILFTYFWRFLAFVCLFISLNSVFHNICYCSCAVSLISRGCKSPGLFFSVLRWINRLCGLPCASPSPVLHCIAW